jgi:SAM-dependent methyltransferase
MTTRGNFGERQEPRPHDWGFLAHQSIYEFAGGFVRGRRCLEIGCGTGYGSDLLVQSGASSLIAIDKDATELNTLQARHPAITFLARDLDLDGIDLPARSVDVVFSSNVFEHLAYPDSGLEAAAAALTDDGIAIIAVPPITSVGALAENACNIFHINNIPTWAWATKLGRYFHQVRSYRHWVRPERVCRSGAIIRDDPRPDDFIFIPDPDPAAETITAIFVAEQPRRPPLAPTLVEEGCPVDWKAAKVEADARQAVVTGLKRHIADVGNWVKDNRAQGTDSNFILDSVCRQLGFLCGQTGQD